MSKLRINPSDELRSEIESGFGAKKSGEDPFDSFVGALGMINVINENRSDGATYPVGGWEGWVLGQKVKVWMPGAALAAFARMMGGSGSKFLGVIPYFM